MKNGIPQLNDDRMKLWRQLQKGYLSTQEKLEQFFFDSQPVVDMTLVISKIYEPTGEKTTSSKRNIDGERNPGSSRLFHGRCDVVLMYPKSGKHYFARIRSKKELVAVEPIQSDRAFWIMKREDLENSQDGVVDLNVISHIRQIHNKRGREILSDFR